MKGLLSSPKGGKDLDQQVYKKLADRVEDAIMEFALHSAEPRRIPPRQVLVCPNNRDGSAPNLMCIHKGILGSIKQKGFDKRRPQVGFAIMYTSVEGKKRLLEHNRRFTKGCALLPLIHENEAIYGSLASSHFNLALRCVLEDVHGPQGDLQKLVEESEPFKDFVNHGHTWIILKEDLPKERQSDISTWRNQDQNENQPTHEVELLQTIKSLSEDLSRVEGGSSRKVPDNEIIARAIRKNPTRQSQQALMSYCKYYKSFVENELPSLVTELVDFHSVNVDPKDLVMPPVFFEFLAKNEVLSKTPFLRHYLMMTNYTVDKKEDRAGVPHARFLEVKILETWAKKPDEVAQMEKLFEDLRAKHLPVLEEALGDRQARLEMQIYADLIIRCCFSKSWPEDLPAKCPISTGKFSEDKVNALGIFWGSLLDRSHPQEDLIKRLGLVAPSHSEEGDEEGLDLGAVKRLRKLGRSASAASDSEAVEIPLMDLSTDLKPGEEVTVTTRSYYYYYYYYY